MCTFRLLRAIRYGRPTGWRQFHMNNDPILCNKVDSDKQHIKMKILNVAEKNDAAKNLAGYLSGGNIRRREGLSKFNKIYEFECNVFNQRCQMIMTSVSGHLLGLEFVGSYRKWQACSPMSLFDAPVSKYCPQDYQQIKRTLEREVRQCGSLIIWTDCDREGENIGFEIIQVCLAVKQNLRVYRAKFSEITAQSVQRALQTLAEPNINISNAVDVRQELDLRIGAAFTRFQTLRLQKVFPQKLSDSLISYGSCQFPTLGFVVERFNAVNNFIPEQFWKIKVLHTIDDLSVDFRWKRVHLFDQLSCHVLYDKCMEQPVAKVENVQSKPKSKWRPLPLDTVEMEKLGSRKLKMNAKEVMRIAEKLYTQGFISYPRTETNIFPKELNLRNLIELQAQDPDWGEFANRVLQDGPNPRAGKKSDQAHPPIHPTKHTASLQGNEKRVYEFVVRHFLACCSKDAEGLETIVDIDIAGEKFVANGLMIIARNYLEVYPYEKWSAKEIHIYQSGQTFEPTSIEMTDGETSAPHLLTEADLIALMEKHGIGTDATHAEHIETIKSRMYVGLQDGSHFVPGELGMGLVEGYDSMGFPMSKPNLRAELEADLKRICDGIKDPKVVLAEQLAKYKEVFRIALQQAEKIDQALGHYLQETAQVPPPVQAEEQTVNQTVLKCPSCGMDMVLRSRQEGTGKFISCMGYPDCRNALWFPGNVEDMELSGESCSECGPHVQKLTFKFRRGSLLPYYPDRYTGCVGGCDPYFLETLDIRLSSVRPVEGTHPNRNTGGQLAEAPSTSSSVDSGLGSLDHGNGSTIYSTSVSSVTPLQTNQLRNDSMRGRGRGRGSNHGTPGLHGRATPASNSTVSSHNEDLIGTFNWNSGSTSTGSGRIPGVLDSGNPHDNAIVCSCNVDAILLTVRKEGPNKGRPFYKCGKPQGQGCNYFMWADDVENNPSLISPRIDNGGRSNSTAFTSNSVPRPSWEMQATNGPGGDGEEVACQCGMPAKRQDDDSVCVQSVNDVRGGDDGSIDVDGQIDEGSSIEPSTLVTSETGQTQKRRVHLTDPASKRPCDTERTEQIHRALAKLIAANQLPLSFASSASFHQFMLAIEPDYEVCKGEALKKQLHLLAETVKMKVKEELLAVAHVTCTSYCWTSQTQDSYLTMSAHIIDNQWKQKSFTLTTEGMEECHTVDSVRAMMEAILEEWGIGRKVVTVVTDNTSNAMNAVESMVLPSGHTCAAYSVQLAANKVLAHKDIEGLCQKAGKIVGHFHHSNLARHALKSMQEQLHVPKEKLIQSVKTQWKSTFDMLERLLKNRNPIRNVLADRKITSAATAQKLEITELEWTTMEMLVSLLKPLQVTTTLFCGDKLSPASMVRPLINKVIKNHLLPEAVDDDITKKFKAFISKQLQEHFNLQWKEGTSIVSAQQISSFLDPRFKDLEDEPVPAMQAIHYHVRHSMELSTKMYKDDNTKHATKTALEFLYKQPAHRQSDEKSQFEGYLAEPQLRFDMDPYEWWKSREEKYPAIAALAKRYLCIPASSASAEKTFSRAGNIVTPKENCLLPENVNQLAFLYQNRAMFL